MSTLEHLVSEQLCCQEEIAYRLASFIKLAKPKRTKGAIQSRIDDVNRAWAECRLRHREIVKIADDAAQKTHRYFTENIILAITDKMDEVRDTLLEHLTAIAPPASAAPPPADESHPGETKTVMLSLPNIVLPKFNGEITAWPNFRDVFKSLVVDRTDLNNLQRLHYLKGSLQGEAARLLVNTPVTDSQFTEAWAILTKRYERKRAILYTHIQRVLDCPKVNAGSVHELKTLLDLSREVRAAFKGEKRLRDLGEDTFVYLVVSKLDKITRRDWEMSIGDVNAMPLYEELYDFLSDRIGAWETSDSSATLEPRVKSNKSKNEVTRSHQVCAVREPQDVKLNTAPSSSNTIICVCCGGSHPTYQCAAFLSLSVPQRVSLMQKHHRCLNCFYAGHVAKACQGKYRCRHCQQPHHTLLHLLPNRTPGGSGHQAPSRPTPVNSSSAVGEETAPTITSSLSQSGFCRTVLPTASVVLTGTSGRAIEVRALLDQGSQSSFMSQSLLQALRPFVKTVYVNITGIGSSPVGAARHAATVSVRPRTGDARDTTISALVLPQLTAYVPPPVPVSAKLTHLSNLPLADRHPFSHAAIDLIIGADYYCKFLRDGLIVGPADSPSAQNTVFGWVLLSGPLNPASQTNTASLSCHLSTSGLDPLPDLLQAFWQVEEVPSISPLSAEDKACEQHFVQTHQRRSDGRYIVRLPFKVPPPIPIGDTSRVALRTWLANEARLSKNVELEASYNEFLREYAALGHMTPVPRGECKNPDAVYLPHHVVVKETSSTTKTRVVFNASSASSNGTTLNDFLLVGPKLQADLFTLILRWRSHQFVYAADLEKMFRQILVHPADAEYQRIFWRPHPEEGVQEYRLATVTYGTAPAPFLANRVLQQLITDEGRHFPLAAPILARDIYVDDLLFGGDDAANLVQIQSQLIALLRAGGFRPYKWISNDTTLLSSIPPEDLSVRPDKPLGEDTTHKVLGIYWDHFQDAFLFKVKPQSGADTKRTFLSLIARIFDPLGWVAPFIISGKILMQRLWLHKVGWDDTLPEELSSSLSTFASQLGTLNQVVVPRWTHQTGSSSRMELHGYADASNSAYSAVVYLRVETSSGLVQVSLLYAKSKVAPLKLLSVPRLELCGAELLVRAISFVQRSMNLYTTPVYCWTDSMTVLSWLQSPPSRWKVFVAHRVAKIQNTLPSAVWKHVPTGDNPADCASRGISASALVQHPLWWTGPSWLTEPDTAWPQTPNLANSVSETEDRGGVSAHISVNTDSGWDFPHKFSSFPRLLRVFCYVLRFINRIRRNFKFSDSTITASEIESARLTFFHLIQEREFGHVSHLDGKPQLPEALRKLKALTPFLDEKGVIRVGGRLSNSLLPFEAKHPILLPAGHIADLLARHAHICTMHGGLRASLHFLRQRYWIINARSVVKRCIHKCVTCTRARAQCSVQLLGDLPKPRVVPSRPFTHTGVDYAGPFAIRSSKGRGIKTHKAYLSIFICLATRAVHLEVADDCTTEGFLAAFNRFTARRGMPSDVYSDNGTNFVGADKELSRRIGEVLRDPDLRARLAGDGLTWHFIPPSASHFGGLWEAGVKSCKYHLKRVIGNFTPTFKEFATFLCKIECVLNSRPIGPLYDDVESLEALTPGHLLTGAHSILPPQPSLLDISENRLGRWQFVSRAAEAFWKRWAADYLNSVQQRGKWQDRQPNYKTGDLVLLKSHHLPPAKWELGRVAACFPGADGLVRVVSVRTSTSEFKRPVTQLCRLPIDDSA